MTDVVTVSKDGDFAVIRVDSPPVNATSTSVRQGLLVAVAQIQDMPVKAAILVCAGKTFIAGGDMTEFDHPPMQPDLPDVVDVFEMSKIPVIAALHGTALGGGFEIAMGCSYRIAQKGTLCGMPEVNVGLIPGAGGTQRLPRLVGAELAADMVSDGKPRSVELLHEKGAIDKIVDGDLLEEAMAFAYHDLPSVQPVSQREITPPNKSYFEEKKEKVTKKAKGQRSPLLNLEAVEWACDLPFKDGQPKERALHLELRQSDESKALRHIFFAQKSASSPQCLKGMKGEAIQNVAVFGGGLMGAGIGFANLLAGMSVVIIEVNDEAVEAAQERFANLIEGAQKRGLIDEAATGAIQSRLTVSDDIQLLADVDLVIEAVVEDLGVKQEVFQKAADVVSDNAILATNTSYLDPNEIFKDVPHQERCVGLHFFAPAHIMKLAEVVKTARVSDEVLARVFAHTKQLKKIPVLTGVCDGFIGNRILTAYRRQADYLLADGALPHEVDEAMRGFGFAVGPYEAQDMSGLQIAWANRQRQAPHRSPQERYIPIADQICEAGWLGQRTGKGWYDYSGGQKSPVTASEASEIIEKYSYETGIQRHSFIAEDIRDRILAAIINEGARIVEEGIAAQMSDVDVVEVFGFGFPRWRGGPMKYAELSGVDEIKNAFSQVEEQSPGSWVRSNYLS